MSSFLREIAYSLGHYPVTHYVLIAASLAFYWFSETLDASGKGRLAAACAGVLFCVSVFDFDNAWQSTNPKMGTLEKLLIPLPFYFFLPITNNLVLYVLIRNLFSKTPVKTWAYTLLCIFHAPLSAFSQYAVQGI
jgi:hypothetical protein